MRLGSPCFLPSISCTPAAAEPAQHSALIYTWLPHTAPPANYRLRSICLRLCLVASDLAEEVTSQEDATISLLYTLAKKATGKHQRVLPILSGGPFSETLCPQAAQELHQFPSAGHRLGARPHTEHLSVPPNPPITQDSDYRTHLFSYTRNWGLGKLNPPPRHNHALTSMTTSESRGFF